MTYSIVARDPATGELGVAAQSRWFNVGGSVVWAEPGVGAVATQSFSEVSYGPLGLARMRDGIAAPEALSMLRADDSGREVRQVGMVDASGRSAAFTGRDCVAEAGHLTFDDVSVQANMMERRTVWPAMADAYRATDGPLADRLLSALRAAEAEGGDVRGRQSAAILIVPAAGPSWSTVHDLCVEDHPSPLDELTRLLSVARAYEAFGRGNEAAMAGDLRAAAAAMDEARALAPDDAQITLWTAVVLGGVGRLDEARVLFAEAQHAEPRSAEHIRRFIAAGLLPPQVGPLIDAMASAVEPQG
jgi:uncharacterized Ntn-hydrolase superfamily protein